MSLFKGWRIFASVALVIPIVIGTILIIKHITPSRSAPIAPILSEITSISMLSSDEGWAVGTSSTGVFITHYQNGHWMRVSAPALPTHFTYRLRYIKMTSPTDGWAIGEAFPPEGNTNTPTPNPYLTNFGQVWLHYDGKAWNFWQNRFSVNIFFISFALNTWWAIGSPIGSETPGNLETRDTYLLHYDGQQIQTLPLLHAPNNGRLIKLTGEQDGWYLSPATATGVHYAEQLYQESKGVFTPVVTVPLVNPGGYYGYSFAMSVANGNGWYVANESSGGAADPTYRTIIQLQDGHWSTPILINTDAPTPPSMTVANTILPHADNKQTTGYYPVTTNQGDAPDWVTVLEYPGGLPHMQLYHHTQGQWIAVGKAYLYPEEPRQPNGAFGGPNTNDLWLPIPSGTTNGSLVRYYNGQWQTWSVQADGSLVAA